MADHFAGAVPAVRKSLETGVGGRGVWYRARTDKGYKWKVWTLSLSESPKTVVGNIDRDYKLAVDRACSDERITIHFRITSWRHEVWLPQPSSPTANPRGRGKSPSTGSITSTDYLTTTL